MIFFAKIFIFPSITQFKKRNDPPWTEEHKTTKIFFSWGSWAVRKVGSKFPCPPPPTHTHFSRRSYAHGRRNSPFCLYNNSETVEFAAKIFHVCDEGTIGNIVCLKEVRGVAEYLRFCMRLPMQWCFSGHRIWVEFSCFLEYAFALQVTQLVLLYI